MKVFQKYSYELLGIFVCLFLGFASGYVGGAGSSLWYAQLKKPFFNPPSWVFGPVWTVLYVCLGLALAKIWQQKNSKPFSIMLFVVQLVLNIVWTPIFFSFHQIGLALGIIVLLWISILGLIFSQKQNKTVVFLLLPYFLWVSFAAMLNWSLYLLN